MVCNICLDVLSSPVVTPCGHLFCLECLISSTQKSPDATKATCPTCRKAFSLVSPDTVFVPEKYRQFINSNVRRVYMNNTIELTLQEKVTELEVRVKSLETQKDLLMDKCESHMEAAISHAQREKEARVRCVALQKELKQSVARLIEKEAQSSCVSMHVHPVTPSPEPGDFLQLGKKRHILGSSPAVIDRPPAPLPKRRRVVRSFQLSGAP